MKVDLSTMDVDELIDLYSDWIKELKDRKIIRTNNFVGELGEYLVVEKYNLNKQLPNIRLADVDAQHFDAYSMKGGKRYSIKTITSQTTGVIYGIDKDGNTPDSKPLFDYLVICRMTKNYHLMGIYQIDWDNFMKFKHWHKTMNAWNIVLSKKVIDCSTIVYEDDKTSQSDANVSYQTKIM